MASITNRKVNLLRTLTFSFALLFALVSIYPNIRAIAQSESDLRSIYDDTTFYDPYSSSCPSTTNNTIGSGNPIDLSGNKVFYIGDSLFYHMAARGGELLTKTADPKTGYSVDVNYVDDRDPSAPRVKGVSVDAKGGINVHDTIPHIAEHAPDYMAADIIVIGLGTNREQNDFVTEIGNLINAIRTNNKKASIYWVNTYFTAPTRTTYQQVNQEIEAASKNNGFSVIDYATAAIADPAIAPTPYKAGGADGIHVDTTEGRKKKADWLISQLPKPTAQTTPDPTTPSAPSTPASPTSAPVGNYDPVSLTFPAFPDEALMAANMERYIREKTPDSPWLRIPNIGTWLMAESKARNVNPMIVMASGRQENNFGTVGSNPRVNNNFFGMKGGGGYIHFNSAEEGMTAFLDALKRNIIDKTHASYKDVTTMYEYFSVHQTGGIHYPGDGMSLGDPQMPEAWISWDSQYNPGNYWKTTAAVISAITGLTISPEIPARGSSASFSGATGCTTVTIGATTKGDASKYIKDCNDNAGNAAIACTAINQLMGLPYSMPQRAAPNDPNPQFLDCSALVNMAVYRTFGTNLGGMCTAEFLSNQYFQTIDVHDIKTGDMVGSGVACGGAGHIAIVVSYDAATKKLITVETGSTAHPSGVRGIGGPDGFNVGLSADGNGGFTWAVRYVGPKTLQPGAL